MAVLGTILTIVAILLIIYLLYWMFSSKATSLSSMQSGTKATVIGSDQLPAAGTNNYTYSMWFYIKDWNYRYGEPKVLLGRTATGGEPSMAITLGAIQNNVTVSLRVYPSAQAHSHPHDGTSVGGSTMHDCTVNNVPVQRWVNLLLSVNGRSADIYIDGKLVRTCVLPGIAKIDTAAAVHVTPGGGFSGFTSNVKYYANSTNPQEAYDIYKDGFGGSILGNLFSKYKIKVAFLEDNIEQGSFSV